MRRFAQRFFLGAIVLVGYIANVYLAIMAGLIGSLIGIFIGLIIFGVILGLTGWFEGVPILIFAALGFGAGVLIVWGLIATLGDVVDEVGRKLTDDRDYR
jgi:hypothetical protein